MAAPIHEPVADRAGRFARAWVQWVDLVDRTVNSLREAGTTADRPTARLWVGRQYFDTTLGHPVWWDGSDWVDASGAPA